MAVRRLSRLSKVFTTLNVRMIKLQIKTMIPRHTQLGFVSVTRGAFRVRRETLAERRKKRKDSFN
jgi:hypothetical protein